MDAKSAPIPIDGMTPFENKLSDELLGSYGITKDMFNQNPEETKRLIADRLRELVKTESTNGCCVYWLLASICMPEGLVDEALMLGSRAAKQYPDDPRGWYLMGTIYYMFTQMIPTENDLNIPERAFSPEVIRQRVERMREFQENNQKLIKGIHQSKLAAESPKVAAGWALQYFKKTLLCNIRPEDSDIVENHIKSIELLKASGLLDNPRV